MAGHNNTIIGDRLLAIHSSVADIISECKGNPKSVHIVAVSKKQPIDKIQDALNAGHRLFGENRLQEAKEKFVGLKRQYPDLQLHFIGPLQTNKAKEAVKICDVIETLDRPALAQKLASAMQMLQLRRECYIQVNIGDEPQKSGISPKETESFVLYCQKELGLSITGLMCIPPIGQDPIPYFTQLKSMAEQYHLPNVSMGMSGDYKGAICCGATHIRLGTAIFGERTL